MAYASPLTPGLHKENGLAAAIRRVIARVADDQRRASAYRKTRRTLEQMTDRDLADIGITRFMINDIAAEAAALA